MAQTDADPAGAEIAAAVIADHGRYLIARRRDDVVLGGYWEFPGGKRRPHESLEDCVRREVHEELGVEIVVGELIERVVHRYPHGTVDLRFFRGTLVQGEPAALGCAEIRWVTPADLHTYRFPPANEPLIRRLVGDQ
jgi:mutator protein MutT